MNNLFKLLREREVYCGRLLYHPDSRHFYCQAR
jgi:hypothetical protein